MNNDVVERIRREYLRDGLREADIDANPFVQFERWFQDAIDGDLADATAMTLATADASGMPSARIVLLKSCDENGFVFYGNYGSRKALEMEANPQASLLFYWSALERQVRITGSVEKESREESESYWKTRPRESQVGAWASEQSSVIPDREMLEARCDEFEEKFKNADVPLPPTWGGFRLNPSQLEFWQGRAARLHDRLQYTKRGDGTWLVERLAP